VTGILEEERLRGEGGSGVYHDLAAISWARFARHLVLHRLAGRRIVASYRSRQARHIGEDGFGVGCTAPAALDRQRARRQGAEQQGRARSSSSLAGSEDRRRCATNLALTGPIAPSEAMRESAPKRHELAALEVAEMLGASTADLKSLNHCVKLVLRAFTSISGTRNHIVVVPLSFRISQEVAALVSRTSKKRALARSGRATRRARQSMSRKGRPIRIRAPPPSLFGGDVLASLARA